MATNRAIQSGLRLFLRFSNAGRFESAMADPMVAQREKLLEIIQANRKTDYGREHGFDQIKSIEDYQARVPRNSYEDLQPYIQRMMDGEAGVLTAEPPLMFATTSGTTGRAKFIPVTPSYLKEYQTGIQVHTYRILADYPEILAGRILVSASSDVEGHTSAGIPYGAIGGLLSRNQPRHIRHFYAVPNEIGAVKDVDAKYYLILRHALEADVRLTVTPNPSSLLLLADKMTTYADELIHDIRLGTVNSAYLPDDIPASLHEGFTPEPERADELAAALARDGRLLPSAVWPNLTAISCWKGGTMPLYLRRLPEFYGDVPIRDFGYMASEGRGGTPLVNSGSGGALAVTSHFFEFVPVDEMDDPDPTFLTCDQLRSDREYFIHFTTSAGLYRYDINDVVRVVDFYRNTPIIQFVRKGSGMTSITGEKLTESQVTAAMLEAVEQLGTDLRHFTVCPEWADLPYYAAYVEMGERFSHEEGERLLAAFDRALCEKNMEYEAKRASHRLGPPILKRVADGSYQALRQRRILEGASEAQVKIPNLSPDMKFGEQLTVSEEIEMTTDGRPE